MKQIKFRAWNEAAKRYSKPFGLTSSVLNYTDDDGIGVVKSLTDEVIEQFTGLKDKNGVDIYEGDELNRKTTFENNMADRRFQDKTKIIVGFVNGCFCNCDTEEPLFDAIRNITYNPNFWTNFEIISKTTI